MLKFNTLIIYKTNLNKKSNMIKYWLHLKSQFSKIILKEMKRKVKKMDLFSINIKYIILHVSNTMKI